MLPRINPIALENGLEAAELKYDLVWGVGYGKCQKIALGNVKVLPNPVFWGHGLALAGH